MRNQNVLITGVGGDIGQGVARCLREALGPVRLIGCDMDEFAGGRAFVDDFYPAPPVRNVEAYVSLINGILAKKEIRYVFPISEAEIAFIDANRERFPKETVFFINQSDIIRRFLDKYETVQFLKEIGVVHPQTYLINDYKGQLGFPVFVKPRKGCGGKGLEIVKDQAHLDFIKGRSKDVVVQELIGGDDEYTMTMFSDGKNLHHIAFKRSLGYGSLSKVAQLIDSEEMRSLAEAVARGSKLEGSLNIQCKKTSAGYVPFEINPRFSSTVYTRHYFGFQDVKWWMDIKEGREVKYSPKFKNGIAVRVLGETFFDMVP